MSLKPLSQSALTAATLRRMAKDLILQAEALEAVDPPRNTGKHVEFKYSKKNRMQNKELN